VTVTCWGCGNNEGESGFPFQQSCPRCEKDLSLLDCKFCSTSCYNTHWARHKRWHDDRATGKRHAESLPVRSNATSGGGDGSRIGGEGVAGFGVGLGGGDGGDSTGVAREAGASGVAGHGGGDGGGSGGAGGGSGGSGGGGQCDPDSYEGRNEAAISHIEAGRFGEAKHPLRKAIAMDSARPEAFYHLGICYDASGHSIPAAVMFARAAERFASVALNLEGTA